MKKSLVFTALLFSVSLAVARPKPQDPSILAFGDSIMSGYSGNGDLRLKRIDFISLVGKALEKKTGLPKIEVWNMAVPGMPTGLIRQALERTQIKRQASAHVLFLNGGGNNGLPLRKKPLAILCDPRTFESFVASISTDFIWIMNKLRVRRDPSKPTVVLGIYYPPVNEGIGKRCGNSNAAEVFLPFIAEANYRTRELALRDNHIWVDLMPLMNCPEAFRSQCAIEPNESLRQYQDKLMRLFKAGVYRDPIDVDQGLIQADRIHPNADGHRLIADHILEALGI